MCFPLTPQKVKNFLQGGQQPKGKLDYSALPRHFPFWSGSLKGQYQKIATFDLGIRGPLRLGSWMVPKELALRPSRGLIFLTVFRDCQSQTVVLFTVCYHSGGDVD